MPVLDGSQIIVVSGLLIGLVYGSVGLLSGFCLLSSLRGWWADGDGRLVRTYALAIGVAVAATQLLAAAGLVDLGKSIYLQLSFSVPVLFLGGLLFGYGMVLSNGCGSRGLVLLGRGNLRADDFNPVPVTSLTFVAPIADSLQYAMLSTGLTLNFGIATVAGVFAGSLITAVVTGRFHFEGYSSPRHMLRSAGGAALMGIGGVMAFG